MKNYFNLNKATNDCSNCLPYEIKDIKFAQNGDCDTRGSSLVKYFESKTKEGDSIKEYHDDKSTIRIGHVVNLSREEFSKELHKIYHTNKITDIDCFQFSNLYKIFSGKTKKIKLICFWMDLIIVIWKFLKTFMKQ